LISLTRDLLQRTNRQTMTGVARSGLATLPSVGAIP